HPQALQKMLQDAGVRPDPEGRPNWVGSVQQIGKVIHRPGVQYNLSTPDYDEQRQYVWRIRLGEETIVVREINEQPLAEHPDAHGPEHADAHAGGAEEPTLN